MITAAEILNARILIVDDLAANVALLEQMLAGAGYRTVSATMNPREVCGLHHQHSYDLILLDLQMPGMDGFEVMAGLKKIEPGGSLPVLVITAQPDHKLRALRAGARDFISKPFDLPEVLLRVHNMIEVRLLHLQLTIHNYARLENSQRIAGLGDWERDLVTSQLVWSDEIYRILGLTRQEAEASAETFDRRVHPDDLALVRLKRIAHNEGLGHVDFDHRIIRPDGTVRHVHHLTETVRDGAGRPLWQSGTMQDITERKLASEALLASEERFKFVARAVSDVVWDWNLPANTLWWNDGFLTTFGFAPGEIEASVETRYSRIHPEDRSRVVDSLQRAVSNCTESWSAEYRFRRQDGTHAFVQDRGYILHDAAGRAVRMVGGMRDLTEQKNAEALHLRAQRMESIGTLAGGIAHDLNNVLAPIMMSIDLLKLSTVTDARRSRILDTIQVSCRRGSDLVHQVLAFARGVDGQRVAIRLRHLLHELEGIIGATFPRNIRIVTEVPANLWPVIGDPSQFHQVLLNLAVNARDAMPDGGILTLAAANRTIDAQFAITSLGSRTGTGMEAGAGQYVLLQVTDTGTGISPEVRERIFDPFFTTKAPGEGTGIGLATVHTVVKNHGGFLTVESEVGRGTTFNIYLPADPALRAETTAPMPVELPQGRGELLLVVDDEFSIRTITQQTLEALGYRVITANNGADAIALFAQRPSEIALVITDMMMPIMDGAATIQVLRRINPVVRIIAASGIDSWDNVAKATRAGATHFLPKPYTTETLLKLVRTAIEEPIPVIAPGQAVAAGAAP